MKRCQEWENPGNFLSLLSILSEHDELLQRHLQAPRDKSAQYMSPQIQNELLSVLSKMILNDILKEIRKAKFFCYHGRRSYVAQ